MKSCTQTRCFGPWFVHSAKANERNNVYLVLCLCAGMKLHLKCTGWNVSYCGFVSVYYTYLPFPTNQWDGEKGGGGRKAEHLGSCDWACALLECRLSNSRNCDCNCTAWMPKSWWHLLMWPDEVRNGSFNASHFKWSENGHVVAGSSAPSSSQHR